METIRNFFFKAKNEEINLQQQTDLKSENVTNQQQEATSQDPLVQPISDSNVPVGNDGTKTNDNNNKDIESNDVQTRHIHDLTTKQTPNVPKDIPTLIAPPPVASAEIQVPIPNAIIPKYREEQPMLFDYNKEFVKFIDHNTPEGFSEKLHEMLPYLGASFISWPTFWLYRGLYWQRKRNTERIGVYIQRSFQQAKILQVAILATGLLMATSTGRSNPDLLVHEVSNQKPKNIDIDN